ncbi:MAG: RtcB family protein [Ruminococcaceae bacterium]|nr:RtcB family protein [Oscillospiraceae bacterium]
MIKVSGEYNEAVCYCGELEQKAYRQIESVCNMKCFAESKIRIMPDVHAGMGCTIGTTMTVTDKVVPGMVGVDIGCGMETVKLAQKEVDFEKLDAIIRERIPYGREVRSEPYKLCEMVELEKLRSASKMNIERAYRSVGTLGGGNHFIEIDRGEDGSLYLVVHSGSRHLGTEVAKYYQDAGYKKLKGDLHREICEKIAKMKENGQYSNIADTVAQMRANSVMATGIPRDMAFVQGEMFDDYIHDMKLTQRFASINRAAMTRIIMEGMNFEEVERFTTVHNYIDTDEMILRKGAVSAKAGEKLLIPINMRDGALICIGKGNEDWNFSAPHGAGRIMSRNDAMKTLSLEQYKTEMQGIYTTCVDRRTLDEAPMAYKDMTDIVERIEPTAYIRERVRPIYNFKASE